MADKNIDKFLADIIKSFDDGVKASAKANKAALEETKKNIDTIQKSLQKSIDKYEDVFKEKFTKLNKLITKEGVSDSKKFREAKKEMDKFQDYVVASEKKKQDLLLKNKNKAEKLEFAYQKDLEKIKKQRYKTSKTDKKLAEAEFKRNLLFLRLSKKEKEASLIKERKDIIAKHELVKKQERAIAAKTKKLGEAFLKNETARYDRLQKNMAKPFKLLSRGFDSIFDKFEEFLTGVFPPLGKLVGFTKKLSIDWILKPLASSMGKAIFNKFIRPSKEKMLKGALGDKEEKEGLFSKLKGTFKKEYEESYAGKKIKAGKERVSAIYGAGKDTIGGVLNTISKGISGFGDIIGKAITNGMTLLVKMLTKAFFSKYFIFGALIVAGIYLIYKAIANLLPKLPTFEDFKKWYWEDLPESLNKAIFGDVGAQWGSEEGANKLKQKEIEFQNAVREEQAAKIEYEKNKTPETEKKYNKAREKTKKIQKEINVLKKENENYIEVKKEIDAFTQEQRKKHLNKAVQEDEEAMSLLNKERITSTVTGTHAKSATGFGHYEGFKADVGTIELTPEEFKNRLEKYKEKDIAYTYEVKKKWMDEADLIQAEASKKGLGFKGTAETGYQSIFTSDAYAKASPTAKKILLARAIGANVELKPEEAEGEEHGDVSLAAKWGVRDVKNKEDLRKGYEHLWKGVSAAKVEKYEKNKFKQEDVSKKLATVTKKTETEKKQEKEAIETEKQKIELEQQKAKTALSPVQPPNIVDQSQTPQENEKTVSLLTEIKDNLAALNRLADRDGLFIKAT